MSECEKCGRETNNLSLVNIMGAQMYVCPQCARFGKPVKKEKKESDQRAPPVRYVRPKRQSTPRDALGDTELELDEEYPRSIQRAREKRGWSREDLGRKINEKVSVISKLEHGQMHPSDKLIKKLEKTLDIRLMVPVENVIIKRKASSGGMTLGDFILNKGK